MEISHIPCSEDSINNTLKTDLQIIHKPYYPNDLCCRSIKADPKIHMKL